MGAKSNSALVFAHVKRIPILSCSRKGMLWPAWYLYIYSCLGIYMAIIVPVITIVPYMITVVPLSALKSRLHVALRKLKWFCFSFIDWKVKNDKPVFPRWPTPCLQVLTKSASPNICLWTSLDATGQTSWNTNPTYMLDMNDICPQCAYQVSFLLFKAVAAGEGTERKHYCTSRVILYLSFREVHKHLP